MTIKLLIPTVRDEKIRLRVEIIHAAAIGSGKAGRDANYHQGRTACRGRLLMVHGYTRVW